MEKNSEKKRLNKTARATAIRATSKWGKIGGEGERCKFNPSPVHDPRSENDLQLVGDNDLAYGDWCA